MGCWRAGEWVGQMVYLWVDMWVGVKASYSAASMVAQWVDMMAQ